MKQFIHSIITTIFICGITATGFAQTESTISGKVIFTEDGKPIHNASVQIVQSKKTVQTDENGNYKLENVPAGRYTVLVHFDGFADLTKTVVLEAGANITLDFALRISGIKEQVTVTASGVEQSTFDSFQSVSTVSADVISQRASTSIGEVLDGESGVAKRSFGSGSARPVIRGFDGDRVLIAQDGIRTGSLGSQSGDHGEPIDPLGVERIEVVKGPATLLYGSNAIGGVVNAISNHENNAHDGFRGYGTLLGGTANRQFGSSGGLEYGYKNFMGWGNGSYQNTEDYNTPLGKIPNSASRSKSGTFGLGYFTDKGFFSGTFSIDRRRYGVPYAALFHSHGHDEEEDDHDDDHDDHDDHDHEDEIFVPNPFELPPTPEDDVDVAMRSYNIRLSGGFRNFDSFITSGTFNFNFNKYRHQELEVHGNHEHIGTTFYNQTASYRGVFEQRRFERLTGRFGFEGFNRSYEVVGDEQLINGKVKQNMFSAFGLEELKFGRVSFQLGGRVENNRYNPTNSSLASRSFTGFSGAAGVRVGLWENGAFVANYSNSYRAPALEELYNNGLHIGSMTYEIGNQNLRRERANGVDFGLRHQTSKIRFETNFYYYGIKDFVYLAFVDEDGDGVIDREDGLPVADYFQGNSQYLGAEMNFDVKFNKYIGLFTTADIVRAKLVDNDLNLPRIPPARLRAGLDLNYKSLNVRPEGVFVSKQDRLYPLETQTGGYGLFNISASYMVTSDHFAHIFGVSGYNLTDRLYRSHLSLIKDYVPEMGRGVRFSYTVRFF